ncbi:MAG: class I SAM-dependent methyltransferase [Terriglobia bacterium]
MKIKGPAAPEQKDDGFARERRRIQAAYEKRARNGSDLRDSLLHPYALFLEQERERALVALLRQAGIRTLAGLRILEVGCGEGRPLRRLLDYGAQARRLVGVDLLANRVHAARRNNPALAWLCAEGAVLPFPDGSFDLVTQGTVFTSVLDPRYRLTMAGEIVRVLRPGGKLLWYDFFYDNPRNPDVRRVGKAELRALFPGFRLAIRRVTVAPPLGRALPAWPLLYDCLAALRIFSSHYLCLGEKP